jgi:hypothetical protein
MNMRPWDPEFDFYHTSWKSARLVITVDLGAEELAPLESHPLRLQARVTMRQPLPDGLRDPHEAEALFALEDLLVRKLGELAPLLQVGRVVGAGELTLVWYAPAVVEARQEELAEAVRQVRGRYQVRLSVAEDLDWRFYFDFLLPDVYNLQAMLNRRRLLTLAEHGDSGKRARLVDHRAVFPSRDGAGAAARALAELGFEVDAPFQAASIDSWEAETDGDGAGGAGAGSAEAGGIEAGAPLSAAEPWALEFARKDSLAEGRIDDVCLEILDAILPYGGHYEGWGVELVSSGAAPR